jgi:ferredoxin
MMNCLKYGPTKKMVRFMLWLSWPIIIAAKRWSALPLLKWIINPFFAHPWNEVTSVPINEKILPPESLILPRRVVERLISEITDIFILDECICRTKENCENYPQDIGCMALGPAISRLHPSHGRLVTKDDAVEHVRRASKAGLIANVAHVWIDPVAFGLTDFRRLMFICFCCDCCCLYRTHMEKRGPNLDRAYKKLPGISVTVDAEKCNGCGTCVEKCFVSEMTLVSGIATVGDGCKGCGRCVEVCPEEAVSLRIENEEILYRQLRERISNVADIWAS